LAIGTQATGGGQAVDFWKVQLAGGDVVDINTTVPMGASYTYDLLAPETTDGTVSTATPVTSAATNLHSSGDQQLTIQAPYSGTFILSVCENAATCGSSGYINPMSPYAFTATLQSGGVSTSAAASETRAGGSIGSAGTLRLGAFEAGGGQAVDFWRLKLAKKAVVAISATVPPGHAYVFDLLAPGTIDGTVNSTSPLASATTNMQASGAQRLTIRAPYSGTFVFSVCEGASTCGSSGFIDPMNPYTFTTSLELSAAAKRKLELPAALRKCSKLRHSKRATCERVARRRYG
jgi:hypothetical protein